MLFFSWRMNEWMNEWMDWWPLFKNKSSDSFAFSFDFTPDSTPITSTITYNTFFDACSLLDIFNFLVVKIVFGLFLLFYTPWPNTSPSWSQSYTWCASASSGEKNKGRLTWLRRRVWWLIFLSFPANKPLCLFKSTQGNHCLQGTNRTEWHESSWLTPVVWLVMLSFVNFPLISSLFLGLTSASLVSSQQNQEKREWNRPVIRG